MQKKEGVTDENAMFLGGLGQAGLVDHMKRNALMRSNSLGHGAGYSSLPPEIRNAMRMGLPNGPLTPASSPSNKQGMHDIITGLSDRIVISRLSIETLSIGSWHRIACTSMDLVCYFSPMEGRFTYYINNSSTGFKIEFPVAYIRSIKLEHVVRKSKSDARDEHRGCMMIDLIQPPLFYSELRGTAGWQLCHDFTQGLVASHIFQHALVGPYEVLHAQLSELATMCPDLGMRLFMDGIHSMPFVPSSEDDQSSVTSGDRSRRHSSAAAMGPPSHPSTLPAQIARQHLAPVPSVPAAHLGGARPRPSFQAHRRTRSRSLPTSVNVSDLAFAASQPVGSHLVPGMKFGSTIPTYVPLNQEMLYNPATPLRIDTSVAGSTLDYYRQFTPSSNMSAQMTPVDFTSPASQVPLQSSLPFYEGPDFHTVGGASAYAHSAMYSAEHMEPSTLYSTEPVGSSSLMGLDQFPGAESFGYTPSATTVADTTHFSAVGEQQWAPQVTVTKQMETDSKEDKGKQEDMGSNMKMEMDE